MQAIFRNRGDEEVEIFTDSSGVNLWHRTGISPNEDGSRSVVNESRLPMSKSQARAIASALMQAAAEL
jgi:hypothetical protein